MRRNIISDDRCDDAEIAWRYQLKTNLRAQTPPPALMIGTLAPRKYPMASSRNVIVRKKTTQYQTTTIRCGMD